MFNDPKTKAREARSDQHARYPEPGDYWNEMFCPVCVVIDVTPFSVSFCKTTESVDANHWTWNLTKIEIKSRKQFRLWLSYDSIPGYWADCSSHKHEWAVKEAHRLHEQLR